MDYAIFMLDVDGHVVSWNPGACRITGYEQSEAVGQHFSKFFLAEDVERGTPEQELAAARLHGRAEEEGWRLRKDGLRFWANVVVTPLHDDAGRLRGYANVVRDLTERRLSEERVRQADERFHKLVDAIGDYAIFLLDADGNVATWNQGARRAKGYTAEEIIGQSFAVFYTEEDRAAGRPAVILDTVRRCGRYEEEGWRCRRDGTLFWASVVISALKDQNQRVVAFAKVTRDLTERRESIEALRRSEERFRFLIDSVTDYAIYMLDADGNVATWNVGAERMKGYSAQEIVGQHFSVFFPPEDAQSGNPARELAIARSKDRFEEEGWRIRKDKSRFWANVVLTAIRGDHGELLGFAKVTRDLSTQLEARQFERKLIEERAARLAAERAEDQLRAAARAAEEANRIKDEFLATVSQELRTPLNAVVGWAAMLRNQTLDPALARPIEVIHRNAQAQVKIIEDILDVSRIVTGKLRLDPRRIDLVTVARDALELIRPSASAKQLSIELDAPAHVYLAGDAERLQQVMWNLLSNAVKFTDALGAIQIQLIDDATSVTVRVRDTGRGIDQALLPGVFERFKQGDASSDRRVNGLGLGLALVRHIVELHGGSVAAESAGAGQGASFSVRLPLNSAISAAPPAAPTSLRPLLGGMPHLHDQLRGVRVLVVEDNADSPDLVTTVLINAGAFVARGSSAASAVELLADFRPHVVVSDLVMPGEGGDSLIARIRALAAAEGGTTPAIALLPHSNEEERSCALEAGFNEHLPKPIDIDRMIEAIARLAAAMRARTPRATQ